MAEVRVCEDPRDDETERQRHDDEEGPGEPERCLAHVVEPEVVDAAVQEQTGDHDDDGGHCQGDSGVPGTPVDERGEKTRGRGTDERGDAGGEGGEVKKFEPQRVRDHADETGDGGHFRRGVEHHREAVYSDEAREEPQEQVPERGDGQLREACGLEVQEQGHRVPGQRGDDDDEHGVGQAFEPGTHVELGKVDAAGDEREAGDDEEHGANVAGFVDG